MFTASTILAGLAATAAAETTFGALVFTRHGDRTAKWFGNTVLTSLGADQTYNSGTFYRNRYIANGSDHQIAGISPDVVVPTQLYAMAPMSGVLYESATHLLQGLYPPLSSASQKLANGSSTVAPLGGYQYILVNGEDTNSPDTIWIQGSTGCPAFTTASATYMKDPSFNATVNSTASFYAQFDDVLGPIMGVSNISYKNAYTVFDLLNVESIHNETVASKVSADQLSQARTLADMHEFNLVYNATQNMRSIGGQTLAAQILSQMNQTVFSKAVAQKFTLMAGSYDTFQAFFGLTNLTAASVDFYGLPGYAASMAFEMFSTADNATFPANPNDDLRVRFLFRNGSDASNNLTTFPLFGTQDMDISYGQFVSQLGARAVKTLPSWCSMCGSTMAFCAAANATQSSSSNGGQAGAGSTSSSSSSGSKLSNAAAGGIGAAVTLAVVGVIAGLAFLMTRKRRSHSAPMTTNPNGLEKKTSGSLSGGSSA
ncbi:phosphoglycerate mutase-like protein [Myriangium duriaei CBS 260.36]|uniref:Phosphoglycerate mutase-like protein n=1 Tax=Myriangium duriaei CBS 260.36 TaxID=1168546 RepID=A0A9P4J935_9PEZI|nr:phosphoglycerate mutase-like protein [Myriangium duriaei CBS 260.36]